MGTGAFAPKALAIVADPRDLVVTVVPAGKDGLLLFPTTRHVRELTAQGALPPDLRAEIAPHTILEPILHRREDRVAILFRGAWNGDPNVVHFDVVLEGVGGGVMCVESRARDHRPQNLVEVHCDDEDEGAQTQAPESGAATLNLKRRGRDMNRRYMYRQDRLGLCAAESDG
eukprot:CAMPEP_0170269670 /NCGR_PEP_ID=MMETSP0116_2-20130129/34775_1 /TAXON_ID=400756 /ORGANISM="Durinskia baltica, Strain CSIRO CS-38" /LENGTH=171 /DNA_ID=CAMNT_0010520853 /DNA_START=433 /DNA_END=946 /DNA_ORIENTATION=-